ncbi:MAG TPA: hypothetical protein DEQ38_12675 [Elusimicrobia bacterium]|nr:MAG: hypothetical protein A2089_08600 [Elusimicrobia bacterium GWD2_63_28]HCC48953.1 hypothetical protein [Elusimicrobiota bacterium]
MTPALKTLTVLAALLALAGAGPAGAELTLSAFDLNSRRASDIRKNMRENWPPVPRLPEEERWARRAPRAARVESSVTVVLEEGEGRADIVFPRAWGRGSGADHRISLFIKLEGEKTPVLSWATVFCSNGRYVGYKGASLELPSGASGEFLIKDEVLALGPLKVRLLRTHPWLAEAAQLGELCARRPPESLKGYGVKDLPAEAAGLAFKYDRGRNALSVTWK